MLNFHQHIREQRGAGGRSRRNNTRRAKQKESRGQTIQAEWEHSSIGQKKRWGDKKKGSRTKKIQQHLVLWPHQPTCPNDSKRIKHEQVVRLGRNKSIQSVAGGGGGDEGEYEQQQQQTGTN
jgi:hypothetical protein